MLKFFYNAAPNPMKVALLLEELALPYEAIPVDTRKGEQFDPGFKAVNPNAKVPAIVDGATTVFDSNAILLYLADREGRFVPTDPRSPERAQLLSWLMFIASGIGPFSGQSVHFRHAAPEPKEYALNRYDFEAHRHWGVLEAHLAQRTFMVGDTYSIVDMAFWGRATPPGRNTPTSSACSMRSAHALRPSAPKRSRRVTHSKRKWTTKPAHSCSRRTSASRKLDTLAPLEVA
jgi:GST-like protein